MFKLDLKRKSLKQIEEQNNSSYIWLVERAYLDTSVFGGYFESEVKFWTTVLFDRISKGEYKVLVLRLVDIELENAPQQVRDLAKSLSQDNVEWLDITTSAAQLAEKCFGKKVMEILKEYVSYLNIPRYSLYQNIGDIEWSILELVKRIIYEDIAKTNTHYSGLQYEKLLFRLSASDEVNLDKLSNVLGIKRDEIEKALDILDKAELINLISRNSNSIDAKIKKLFLCRHPFGEHFWQLFMAIKYQILLEAKCGKI